MFGAAKQQQQHGSAQKTTVINSDLEDLICAKKPAVEKTRNGAKKLAMTSKKKLSQVTLSKDIIKFSTEHDIANHPLFPHTTTTLPPMFESPSRLKLSPSNLKLSVHNLTMESTLAAADPSQLMNRTARKPVITVKSLSPKVKNATQFGQFRYSNNNNKDNAIVGNGDFVSCLKHSPSQVDHNEFVQTTHQHYLPSIKNASQLRPEIATDSSLMYKTISP